MPVCLSVQPSYLHSVLPNPVHIEPNVNVKVNAKNK